MLPKVSSEVFIALREGRSSISSEVLSSASPSFLLVSLQDSKRKLVCKLGTLSKAGTSCGMGTIAVSSSSLKIKICTQKLKVFGEMLSPCGRPLSRLKILEREPSSSRIQAVQFVPNRVNHFIIDGPNPKNLNTLSKKLLDKNLKSCFSMF